MSSSWTALEGVRRAHSGSTSRLQAPELLRLLLVLAALTVAGILAAAATGALAAATALRLASLVGLGLVGFLVATAALAGFDRLQRRGRGASAVERVKVAPVLLERAERRLELAVSFAAQFEQLRRELRVVAEQRLGGRGLRFESEAARELLGGEVWQLLAEPRAADKFSAGVERARLERLLQALEGV